MEKSSFRRHGKGSRREWDGGAGGGCEWTPEGAPKAKASRQRRATAPVIQAARIKTYAAERASKREAKLSGTTEIPPQRTDNCALGRFS